MYGRIRIPIGQAVGCIAFSSTSTECTTAPLFIGTGSNAFGFTFSRALPIDIVQATVKPTGDTDATSFGAFGTVTTTHIDGRINGKVSMVSGA